ncbi:hypothetical protein K7432_006690 [Basidiobolus ranarum]|uniref:Uncharacterized protein n=1 Tax=Basidiobolus ranarum TaxID=34480 RepID=A0ABR2WUI7_9FUNG
MEEIYGVGEKHELNSLNGHINPRDFGARAIHTHPREFLPSDPNSSSQKRRHSVSYQQANRTAPYAIPNGKEIPFGRPRHSSEADIMERIIFTPREGDHDRTYNALYDLVKKEILLNDPSKTNEQIRILTSEILDLFRNTSGSDQEKLYLVQQLFPKSPQISTEVFAELIALTQRLVLLNYQPNETRPNNPPNLKKISPPIERLLKGATLPHSFMNASGVEETLNDDEMRVGGQYQDVEYDSEISTKTDFDSD